MDIALGVVARSGSTSFDSGIKSPDLMPMERRILLLLSQGYQSKEIAVLVGRAKPTVEGYIRTLYAKFGARSRAHLIDCAYKCGVLGR